MNVLGLVFGFAIARGRPDASRIALVSALPRSPVLGLVLASALARNKTPLQAKIPSTIGVITFSDRDMQRLAYHFSLEDKSRSADDNWKLAVEAAGILKGRHR
jgi:hypothetical protein